MIGERRLLDGMIGLVHSGRWNRKIRQNDYMNSRYEIRESDGVFCHEDELSILESTVVRS